MKQATGSNRPGTANKVSIQLSLDGHSFSVDGFEGISPDSDSVEVEVLTPDTILVPEELFDEASAERMLAANGISSTTGKQIIYSDSQDGIVCIMSIPIEAFDRINEKPSTRARFVSPLLHVPSATTKTVWICTTGGLLYIKVYDESLRFAEVIPTKTEMDIHYLFEQLEQEFRLAEFGLRIAARGNNSGEHTGRLLKLLKNRFKTTICE